MRRGGSGGLPTFCLFHAGILADSLRIRRSCLSNYLLTLPGPLTKENYASRRISFDFAIAPRGPESNIPELPLQVSK